MQILTVWRMFAPEMIPEVEKISNMAHHMHVVCSLTLQLIESVTR